MPWRARQPWQQNWQSWRWSVRLRRNITTIIMTMTIMNAAAATITRNTSITMTMTIMSAAAATIMRSIITIMNTVNPAPAVTITTTITITMLMRYLLPGAARPTRSSNVLPLRKLCRNWIPVLTAWFCVPRVSCPAWTAAGFISIWFLWRSTFAKAVLTSTASCA